MSAPVRIQRQRTKGWRMPEGAVYVGRPSRWGNPFRVEPMTCHRACVLSRQRAKDRFRDYVVPGIDVSPLRDATALACWCPLDQPCHADILIELLS